MFILNSKPRYECVNPERLHVYQLIQHLPHIPCFYSALIWVISAICPNMSVATAFSIVVMMILVLYDGQTIPLDILPNAIVWIYYINPFQYVPCYPVASRAAVHSQTHPVFNQASCCTAAYFDACVAVVLLSNHLCVHYNSWQSMALIMCFYVACRFFFRYCIKALIVNEFSSAKYAACVIPGVGQCPPGVGTIEETVLSNYAIRQTNAWIWIGLVSWFECLF